MSDQIKELVVKLRDTIMTSRGLGQSDEELVNPDGPEAADALEAMAGEVDTLQMKLAACGVGALANTERTVAQRITKESPYWSASLGAVYHIVDKEMEARAERDRLAGEVEELGNLAANYEHEMKRAVTERDRLKAALEFIARGTTGSPDAIIARKALGDAS